MIEEFRNPIKDSWERCSCPQRIKYSNDRRCYSAVCSGEYPCYMELHFGTIWLIVAVSGQRFGIKRGSSITSAFIFVWQDMRLTLPTLILFLFPLWIGKPNFCALRIPSRGIFAIGAGVVTVSPKFCGSTRWFVVDLWELRRFFPIWMNAIHTDIAKNFCLVKGKILFTVADDIYSAWKERA